ncbi:cytochrome D1 domain-containing protein [Pseudorhodobacter turbinis]|nr:cytochrome D1 domain-containing protein [Pseudorhodobacter turbinis]
MTHENRALRGSNRILGSIHPHAATMCRRSLVVALTVATIAWGSAGIAQTGTTLPAGGMVFTADEYSNSLSRIDLSSGDVTTVPATIVPHNVQISPDGSLLLAVGMAASNDEGHGEEQSHGAMAGMEGGGELVLFDPKDLAAGPMARIPVGMHPAHVITDIDGKRAFVTNAADDTLSVIDLASREVIASVATGDYPHGQRTSPDGRVIWVANVNSGNVSVIDTGTLKEVARIDVGATPVQVGFLPDGSRAYVSLRDENSVAVVDTNAQKVIATVKVGRGPIQLYATPDGRFVYVANQGTEADPDDTVSVIDVATNSVTATIPTGRGAHGVTVSSDGRNVFVTNMFNGTVSVIDVASQAVLANIPVGEGASGITYRP